MNGLRTKPSRQIERPIVGLLLAFTLLDGQPCVDAAEQRDIGSNARNQIESLIAEKAARSPVHRKLDSQIIYALRHRRQERVALGVDQLQSTVRPGPDGRVLMDLRAQVEPELLAAITAGGGTVLNSQPRFHAIRAWVPLELVETLAARPEVRNIRPADEATSNTGPITSQGDIAHQAKDARNSLLVDGSGVKIGVLSDSVDYLANSQANGELPAVTVLPGRAGAGAGEGTAMLEIVHDLAPGSELYFSTAFQGVGAFAQSILDLQAAGCRVIVDDISYYAESPFQDGPIAQAVNEVSAAGTLYFSSAGNSGNLSDGTASTWQGDFKDGGPATFGRGGRLHDFGGSTLNGVKQGSSPRVDLFWADPLGRSTNDYDVYLVSASGAVVAASSNVQDGDDDPSESIGFTAPGTSIVIVKYSGADRYLYLSGGRSPLTFTTSGATRGHNASGAPNAFCVAATWVRSPAVPFSDGTVNPVETFSSDGPRRIFFHPDGTPITPGNLLATGGLVLQKPDLTAADGVSTSVPGFDPFFGTSAAAPHAAAIAALLLSQNPLMTPAEIRLAMESTAIDIEALGRDRDSGAGIVMALAALQAPAVPVPRLVVDSTILNGGNGNGTVDADECGDLFVTLRNLNCPCGEAASNIVARLESSTPGVLVDPAPLFFPDVPPAGLGANQMPFRISTAPNYSCATPARFVLHVTSENAGEVHLSFQVSSSPPTAGSPLTFVSSDGPRAIPDPGMVESILVVSNVDQQLDHVRVGLYLTHSFDSDLAITLISPDGTAVELSSANGGSGDNYGTSCAFPTFFDDDATTSITTAAPPFSGSFRPEQPLKVYRGKSPAMANGEWKLRIRDLAPEDSGILQCWSLDVTPIRCMSGGGACLVAPHFTSQPQDVIATNGGTLQFNAAAAGTGILAFQWYFNTTNLLVDATNASLTLEEVTLDQAGDYTVVVSNPYGSVTSAPARLTIVFPPLIVQSPRDILATNGSGAQFAASATGTAPLSYQWVFNETNALAGATNAILTLANVSPASAGTYSVVVSNPYGTVFSAEAVLEVAVRPFITQQPQSLATNEGGTAVFAAGAGGSEPLFYYWYSNETNLVPSSTGPTLVLTNVAAGNAGGYSLIVSNAYGYATTVEAELSVYHVNIPPVVLLIQPNDGAEFPLDSGPIRLEASATDPDGSIANVEFFANGVPLSQSAAEPYLFEWADAPPGRSAIQAIATDRDGARATSSVASITVNLTVDFTRLVPTGSVWKFFDQGVDLGAVWRAPDFDDSIWATGPAQLGYGDNDEATVVSFGPSDTDKYITTYFRRVFALTDAGSFTNLELRLLRDDGAIVYLNNVEIFRSNLPEGEVDSGTLALAAVTGTAEQSFVTNLVNPELLVNGTNVLAVEVHQADPGSSDLSFDLELLGQRSFAPRFRTQPGNQTVPEGTLVEFFTEVDGAKPLLFQWLFNGSLAIPGATNSTLFLPNVSAEEAGLYTLIVSNAFGVAISSNAALSVLRFNNPPEVSVDSPADGSSFGFNDGNILLAVTATDLDGAIDRVEFLSDGALLGTASSAPYAFEWLDARVGSHALAAVAFDTDGAATTSAVVHITVNLTTNLARLAGTGTIWKYSDTGIEPGPEWKAIAFDDSTWASGPSQLGYGDGDEATVIGFGPSATSKFPTTYFRRTFMLTDAPSFTNAVIRLLRDDGAVVYLNEVEVFRSNMPEGEIDFATYASSTVSGAAESVFVTNAIDSSLLRNGTNLLAVEIHQANATSSDVSFDLELEAERLLSPLILEQPVDLSVSRGATVTFRVAASGTAPLAYQWYFNDTNVLPGATGSELTFENADPSASGLYRVHVSNFLGATVSEAASLWVSATNLPPQVTLITPTEGTTYFVNAAPIVFEASAEDSDGTIAQVAFFADGVPIGTAISEPYTASWLDAPVGTHDLWAVATDALGANTTSATAHITVLFSTNNAQLVSSGAIWKYLDTGVDQGASWREIEFDDAAWPSGPAELGYGDASAGRPEATVIGFGPNANAKYPTAYFRRAFVLTDAASFTNETVHLIRDDGAVVYLNGVEIFRSNMPTGLVAFSTLASTTVGGADETNYFSSAVGEHLLRNGTNVIAVEVHQANATSSDLSFDLAFIAERPTPPFILEQPISLAVTNGGSATFTVEADGSRPLAYQWYRDQTNRLDGATNASLTIEPATALHAGAYSVEIANSIGLVRSASALLVIDGGENLAPIVELQAPANSARFDEGAAISILAIATDLDGEIGSVAFYADGALLAEDFESPYAFNWTNAPIGLHAIWAVAVDAEGASAASAIANLSVNSAPGVSTSLVSTGAVWNYLDDGTDQGTAWRALDFDASAWASGPAELGYGDDTEGRPEATVLGFGDNAQNKYVTYYFRHIFLASEPQMVQALHFELLRDDGAVVYLNGQEVFRDNMPEGDIDYLTTATATVSLDAETQFVAADPDPSPLREGTNVVAVEIHQVNRTSSDISFDLSLVSTEANPPQIILGPLSRTVTNGDLAEFQIETSELGPQSYQWFFNTTNQLTGETNAVLSLTNVGPAFAGTYAVVVRNAVGTTCSDPAMLAVIVPPQNHPPDVTLLSPLDESNYPQQAAIPLSALAEDPDGVVIEVEFFADDNRIGVATHSPYLFDWIGAPLGKHTLRAVATDDRGGTNSSAPITINVLLSEPDPFSMLTLISTGAVWNYLDTGVDQGSNWRSAGFDDSSWPSSPAELGYGDAPEGRPEATVLGFGPDANNKFPTYYFRRAFALTNAAAVTELRLRVMRDDGVIVYLNGTEVFRDNLPEGPISFTDLALKAIANEDESSFLETTIPVGALVEGTNIVAAEIHQVIGTSSDISFDLEMVATRPDAPIITVQPSDQNVPAGDAVQFAVTATGGGTLAYQWYRNSLTPLPDATNNVLNIPNAQFADEGSYSVIVTNAGGSVRSQSAILRILNAPVIEAPPQDITVLEGNSAVFTVVASGAEPLTYRWFHNTNTEIEGVDGATLTVPFATLADAGTYGVTISNAAGSASSLPASLRVLVPTQIMQVWRTNGAVAFAFHTEPGLKYTVDFKNTLNLPTWNLLPGAVKLNGTGGPLTVEDPGPIPLTRFYRVRIE